MANWAHVQSAIGTTNGEVPIILSFPGNVTTGNLIIIDIQSKASTVIIVSVIDSLGNNYTLFTGHPIIGEHRMNSYYAKNITGGACTITVTFSTFCDGTLAIHEYSGCDTTSPAHQFNGAIGANTSPDSGNIVTTLANCLIHGSFGATDPSSGRHPNGIFTPRQTGRICTFDLDGAAAGTYHAFGTVDYSGGGANWVAIVGAFSTGAAPPPPATTYIDSSDIGQMAMSRLVRVPYN